MKRYKWKRKESSHQVVTPVGKMNLVPLDEISGFAVRPGFYEINGATNLSCGVNFTVHSMQATSCELLLFHQNEKDPFAVLPFPEQYKIGHVYSMIVFGLDIEKFEYAYRLDGPYAPEQGLIFDKTQCLLDPYARAVTGQSEWGKRDKTHSSYRARVVEDEFDWGHWVHSGSRMSDLIIYELHVRGYTRHDSSGVRYPGTFAGLMEKIPYLKNLGINAVELMPIFEFDELRDNREHDGHQLLDYWGYNSVGFFAPNTSYSAKKEFNREGNELKRLIRALHENGIEVFLDVVFNHTAEGDDRGPFFSFKGFDNNIYYMLTPEGQYYNFSGCGNTLNCNHPIVQQMILECLRYWVINYRVDGFRFDLASILGRNEDGSPMNKPPLLQSLAFDPVLGDVKLVAEAWDAGGLYQVGSFPSWNRWAEWNGKYRDDLRSFIKGDSGMAKAVMQRLIGSPDLYNPQNRGEDVSVNFINCHDGFTLYDLYSYNQKHNLQNGWNNTDGSDDNRSWNCGAEGPSDDPQVLSLRWRLMRNAFALLMCSRGTPMFLAGDEFGNTQFGNNNPYCQDNVISWLDWTLLEKNRAFFKYCRSLIAFRKAHPVLRRTTGACSFGFPEISFHGETPWQPSEDWETRTFGVMFAGKDDENRDDVLYLAINAFWEPRKITLPDLPPNWGWFMAVDTNRKETMFDNPIPLGQSITLEGRSVAVLTANWLEDA